MERFDGTEKLKIHSSCSITLPSVNFFSIESTPSPLRWYYADLLLLLSCSCRRIQNHSTGRPDSYFPSPPSVVPDLSKPSQPTVREADALFLRLVRQLNQLRAGIWVERAHVLDPTVRPGQTMFLKAQSGTSSTEDTPRACTQSTTWPKCNFVTSPTGASKDFQTK